MEEACHILFWICVLDSIVRPAYTSFWVIIFSTFSSTPIYLFYEEEAIFAL